MLSCCGKVMRRCHWLATTEKCSGRLGGSSLVKKAKTSAPGREGKSPKAKRDRFLTSCLLRAFAALEVRRPRIVDGTKAPRHAPLRRCRTHSDQAFSLLPRSAPWPSEAS